MSPKFQIRIVINYVAFCDPMERKNAAYCLVDWPVDSWDIDRYEILETVFKATNLQHQATGTDAKMWDAINEANPPKRSHTSVSVGDYVTVDGIVFRCEPTGWAVIG